MREPKVLLFFLLKGMDFSKHVLEKKHHVSSGDSSEDMAKELFSKLPNKLVEQLYQLYKYDFEMFDYEYKQDLF